MKNNKGFAPIAIILAVIVLFAVGGGVYYAGKSSNTVSLNTEENNNQFVENQNDNKITTPNPTSSPQKSGINGVAIVKVCSGVPSEPGHLPCKEQPYTSYLLKIRNDSSGIEKQVTTDNAGKFQIKLLPGKYTIPVTDPRREAILGGPFNIEVKSELFTNVQLRFEAALP